MSHRSHLRRMFLPLLGAAYLVFGGYRFLAQSNTQDTSNAPTPVTIRRAPYAIDDAVRIVGFRLDGQYYDLSKTRDSAPIRTKSGWLERLQFFAQNLSPKSVIAGTIQVTCPAMGNGHTIEEPRVWDQFSIGTIPDRFSAAKPKKDASSAQTQQPISIAPKGEMYFVLQNDFARMRKKVTAGGPTPDCTVDPRAFFFSDGSMWSPRHFFMPDPGSNHGYVSITPEEFGIEVPAQYK